MPTFINRPATDKGKKGLMKAMAFLGGTLNAIERDSAQTASEQGLNYQMKHNYRNEVEDMINRSQDQLQVRMSTPQVYQQPVQQTEYIPQQMPLQQMQPVYYQQPVQPQYQTYTPQPIQTTINMPDISDYIGGKEQVKPQPQAPNNELLTALNEANKPILAMLDIVCKILGKIYKEQEKTNAILGNVPAASPEIYEQPIQETEPLQSYAEATSIEDEIAKLDAMSAQMSQHDLADPEINEAEISM